MVNANRRQPARGRSAIAVSGDVSGFLKRIYAGIAAVFLLSSMLGDFCYNWLLSFSLRRTAYTAVTATDNFKAANAIDSVAAQP